MLAATRLWEALRGKRPANPAWWARALRVFWTVQFVCLCWVFFRAGSVAQAIELLQRIGSLTFSTANLSADILTFARSKGLYGGVSLKGAVVKIRAGLNAAYYGKPATPTVSAKRIRRAAKTSR